MKILVFVGVGGVDYPWHWKEFPNVRGKITFGISLISQKNSTNKDWESTIKIMCE